MPASQVPRDQASSSALLSLSATTNLWRAANLSWDLAATAERRISPTATLWSALNGLSASRRLATALVGTARQLAGLRNRWRGALSFDVGRGERGQHALALAARGCRRVLDREPAGPLLRGSGVDISGPSSFSQSDRQAFAAQLDRFLAKHR